MKTKVKIGFLYPLFVAILQSCSLSNGFDEKTVFYFDGSTKFEVVDDSLGLIIGSLSYIHCTNTYKLRLEITNSKIIDSANFKLNLNNKMPIQVYQLVDNNDKFYSFIPYPLKKLELDPKKKYYYVINFNDSEKKCLNKITLYSYVKLRSGPNQKEFQGIKSFTGRKEIYFISPNK